MFIESVYYVIFNERDKLILTMHIREMLYDSLCLISFPGLYQVF